MQLPLSFLSLKRNLTLTNFGELQSLESVAFVHDLNVKVSTSPSATVVVQVPPKLLTVFKSVMYVPPTIGSATRAKNAIISTNITVTVTWKWNVT